MTRGNRGEWGEVYAFAKLISEGQLETADERLQKIPNESQKILKLKRRTSGGLRVYDVISENVLSVYDHEGKLLLSKDMSNLRNGVKKVFDEIKSIETRGGSFPLKTENLLIEDFGIDTTRSASEKKEDFSLVLQNPRALESELGFSVKSMFGGNPTLFNASHHNTNFIYHVEGIGDDIAKTKLPLVKLVNAIIDAGGKITFQKAASETFDSNLRKIDGNMPTIIGELLLNRYLAKRSKLTDAVQALDLGRLSGFGFTVDKEYITLKLKQFLFNVALGMVSAKPWKGDVDVKGGLIVVKDDGDVVAYMIFDLDKFKQYLFENTRFETPSTTRHDFGTLYQRDNSWFINLNLQIRFFN